MAAAVCRLMCIESGGPVFLCDIVPISAGCSGGGEFVLMRGKNAELDMGVFCPGDGHRLVYRDGVKRGKNWVQEVTAGVGRSFDLKGDGGFLKETRYCSLRTASSH
mgnify:CR=1 FL=1